MTFNTALSGIRAANSDLQVTGNNIANASTAGFKESRAEFTDVYATSLLGGGSNAIGSGVQLAKVSQQFDQGNLNFTQNELDMAISGNGFFVLADNNGDTVYSRNGTFGLDQDGYVVSGKGSILQGFTADDTGRIGGVLGDIRIQADTQPPRQTTLAEIAVNLDANEDTLQSIGSSFATDGSVVGLAQSGQFPATTTTLDAGVVATPIDFAANPTTFNLTLAGSTPASGNGTSAGINLAATTANSVQDIANLINSAIFSAASPINVQAIVGSGGELQFEDLSSGVSSTITIANVTGANALSTALSGAPASVAGIAEASNGYGSESFDIINPDGDVITYTSTAGAPASQTASELNALVGVSATATTEATIESTTFNNLNSNLVLNSVTLSSTTLAGLETEINALSSSTLPGVTASLDSLTGDLVVSSQVGDDLVFTFAGNGAGTVDITGRFTTAAQTLTNAPTNQAVAVGGSIDIVLEEEYSVDTSTFSVGNLFAPVTSTTFTPLVINAFNPADQATYNHATSSTVYDSLGNSHVMTQYFVKQEYDPADPTTSPNHWVMYVQIDGNDVGDPDTTLPAPDNTLATQAAFNIHFNEDGSLNTLLTDSILVSNWVPVDDEGNELGALGPLNALAGGSIPVAEPPTSSNFEIDIMGTTQFGNDFSVDSVDQNGYTTGRLTGLDVDETGVIFARYSNGEAQALAQVALADFANQQGLEPVGNSEWVQTFASGQPNIGAPGTSSLGGITSGALEESNVDLSEQLVNLIIAQRNYQASAKTIETANEVTQTVINLR